ncbi:large conductance mechanosensitive channel protein MscL [Kineosporia sp. R_H_3]|uniref:large conductance mechanosensitive channel protein MscL n=1 Tax=Kineosporia sp. R_H_3 TaxID=1961848 RepID=UPI000B4B9ADF|nr:large conductance mechanosensitive channel protein MscL [Kineosporia sp. R_H_3]
MIKGFREFIMRGNVVDLAVAVVIGAAFSGIVTKFVESVINPIVASFGGGGEIGWGVQLGDEGNEATFLNLGAVISAAINFVIIAAVVYFILVVPMNKLQERRKKGLVEEPAAPAEDVILLTEIRDLLRAQNNA